MWNRKELKAKGKEAFKSNYWACVLAAVIILTVALGSYAGVSIIVPSTSVGSISLAANPIPAFADEDITEDIAEDVEEDIDEIPDLDLDDLGLGDILSEAESEGEIPLDTSSMNMAVILALLGIVLSILSVIVVLALVIKILILNPIQVAGYQFFKENALERTPNFKLSFNNEYKNIVLGMFLRSLFIALWSMLFIIPGIIKSYSYRMVPFILTDNPGITATDAITRSREMMKGNKWRAFVLDLSFLGWYILSALTLGILGIFYVNPYVYATEAELYHAIKPVEAVTATEVTE